MKHRILFLSFWIFSGFSLLANGLQVSITGVTASAITFDISWNNSWNISNLNRDAVWIFVKYQDCSTENKTWNHLGLNAASNSHTIAGSLLQVDAVSDGKGVFIRRATFGGGDNPVTSVTLTFSTPLASVAQVNFNVVGLEMVYVPEAGFIADYGLSTRTFGTNATNVPSEITSEAA